MKPIIAWELRQRRFALLWWTVGVCALLALLFLLYPSIHQQAAQFNETLKHAPSSIRSLKAGGAGNNLDIGSPIGFLNSQIYYITLPILLIILAITRGSALIGREEQDHTLELLLSRPVGRGKLLLAKASSGLLEILIVGAAGTLVSLILANRVHMDLPIRNLVLVNLYTVLFSLSFGAISFTLIAFGRLTKRLSSVIAVLISFGGWIITSLQDSTHYLKSVAKIMPYHYFEPQNILAGHVSMGLNSYLIGVLVLTVALSYLGFRRRDIA